MIAPAGWTGFDLHTKVETAYDSMGRKVREAVSGNDGVTTGVTEYSYDPAGRLKCTAVRMNPDVWAAALGDKCVPGAAHAVHGPDRISRNHYTVHGELLKVEKAVGTGLQQVYAAYTYSPNGKPTSVTDANGNRAEMTWDGLDRQKRWIFPSKTVPGTVNPADYEEYGYDANANRTSLRKRDGTELIYQYDALSRMTQKTVPASATGAAGYSVFYGYDLRGLQTFARFGSASGPGVTNLWDGFGRLASSATNMDGVSRALSSQYDADGNRTALTGDQGYSAAFSYDGLGRMKAYADIVQFSYDSAGRRSSLNMGPGWTSSTAGYGYDPAGRLQTLTHELAGTSGDQELGFAYNPASQVQTRSASNDAFAWGGAYNVSRNYAANGLNQYTGTVSNGEPSATFQYDDNGNLTSDGSTAFVYDSENRLVSASGAKTASLIYDPLGRLWQVSSGAATTRFLYDGDRLAMEYNSAGAATRSYVHGPGTDEPLVWYEAALGWARRFLHADHQGSIIALNDDGGNPVAINSYDPWGIPKAGAGHVGRFGYTGQTWIPELGLWYYKARFYSPTTGRFLQVDPIGYADQMNLYGYVGNDPVDRTDPGGLYTCEKKECPTVAKIVGLLASAARSSRMQTGSLVPTQASRVLTNMVGALGKQGEGSIHIENASLKSGTLGEYSRTDSGGHLIQMDFGQINKLGGGPIAAATLGHELTHGAQDTRHGPARSLEDLSMRERQAYRVGAWVLHGLGWSSPALPDLTDRNFESSVRHAAEQNCLGSAIAYEDAHQKRPMLPGNCK